MKNKKMPVELSVKCPKCHAKVGRRCINTKTGHVRNTVHESRELRSLANTPAPKKVAPVMTEEQKAIGQLIEKKTMEILGHGFEVKFVKPVSEGPIITAYRFELGRRTRVSHMEGLAKDFATLLGTDEPVMVKRMIGETNVGVFVPNKERKYVNFRDTIQYVQAYMNKATKDGHLPIPMMLGQDAVGNPVVDDLTQQPHLLVSGTTGGGKSTLLHSLITGMAWVMTPKQLMMILSDTKTVEFTHFARLPHLQFPIAKTVFETMQQMEWICKEAQRRMNVIAAAGVRNIHEYNKQQEEKMPYIVLIIDELADIMGDQLEKSIRQTAAGYLQTIVQRARTSGVCVIGSTQRPGVSTVKGAIKANFPSRLTFRLPSQIDSRTVINTKGAEQLMTHGDMLYTSSTAPELKRIHAPFTSIADVKTAVDFIVHREKTRV